jgi:hypothetical protein
MEFDAGLKPVGPGLVIVGMGPGQRQFWLRLPLFIEIGQRVEDQCRRGLRGSIVHADLQGIEAGNIQFLAYRNAAALLLRSSRSCG